jgi:hypothetical protein
VEHSLIPGERAFEVFGVQVVFVGIAKYRDGRSDSVCSLCWRWNGEAIDAIQVSLKQSIY